MSRGTHGTAPLVLISVDIACGLYYNKRKWNISPVEGSKENDRAGRQPVERNEPPKMIKAIYSDIKNRPATDGNLLQVPVCTVSHTVAPVYIIIPQISKSVNGVIATSGTCNKVSEVFYLLESLKGVEK